MRRSKIKGRHHYINHNIIRDLFTIIIASSAFFFLVGPNVPLIKIKKTTQYNNVAYFFTKIIAKIVIISRCVDLKSVYLANVKAYTTRCTQDSYVGVYVCRYDLRGLLQRQRSTTRDVHRQYHIERFSLLFGPCHDITSESHRRRRTQVLTE